MTEGRHNYSETYAAMASEELLALTRDTVALTDEAQAALRKEVDGRQLGWNADQGAFPAGRQPGHGGSRPTRPFRRWWTLLDRQLDSLESSGSPVEKSEPVLTDIEPDAQSLADSYPIRGWFLVLTGYMICVPVLQILDLWRQNSNLRFAYEGYSGFRGLVAAWDVATIPALLLMIYAGISLLGKWRHSVRLAKISLVTGMIVSFFFSIAFALYRTLTVDSIMNRTPDASVLFSPIRHSLAVTSLIVLSLIISTLHAFYQILPNIIALFYLHKSRRVPLPYYGA